MTNFHQRIGFALVLAAGTAHAQNCPEGMVSEGSQGVASCVPVEGDDQPRGHWVSQWGLLQRIFRIKVSARL